MCKGLASLPTCCLERYVQLHADNMNTAQCKMMHVYASFSGISCLSSDGLCAFTAFLVSEFSEENIAFYFACEDYRSTKCHDKLPAKAQKIYNEFIGSDAPREVNIDHETRDITKANMLSPSPSCFDQAQHKIYMLMAKDCYPRFLRSSNYRDLVFQHVKNMLKTRD
uniref:Regulator of G-protein signaling 5-like n=1 Tax=Salarias fasciatus TaxID=181472 RepID=A0A672F6H4_SALFA